MAQEEAECSCPKKELTEKKKNYGEQKEKKICSLSCGTNSKKFDTT